MIFEEGKEVAVRRALGERRGDGKGKYYYGGNIADVPLGTRGTIYNISSKNMIRLRTENSMTWAVHPDEIALTKEQIEYEEEQEKELSALVDKVLSEEPDEPAEPVAEKESRERPFEPKFNVREEFALWVRDQFPELEKYANKHRKYHRLLNRMEEVMGGARLACEHGVKTTRSCVKEKFEYWLVALEESFKKKEGSDFGVRISYLVNCIEHIAANLGERTHYGTHPVPGELI